MKKLSVLLSLFILSLAVVCPASAAVNPSLRTDVLFCIAEKANGSGGFDNVVALFNKDDANIQKDNKTADGWDFSFTRDDPKSKGRIRSFRMPDGENRFIYTEFKSGLKDKIKLFNPNTGNYATPSDLTWDDASMLTGTPATHGDFLYFAGRDNCIIYKADMTNKCALSDKIDLNIVPGFDEIKALCGAKKAHVMRLATLESTMYAFLSVYNNGEADFDDGFVIKFKDFTATKGAFEVDKFARIGKDINDLDFYNGKFFVVNTGGSQKTLMDDSNIQMIDPVTLEVTEILNRSGVIQTNGKPINLNNNFMTLAISPQGDAYVGAALDYMSYKETPTADPYKLRVAVVYKRPLAELIAEKTINDDTDYFARASNKFEYIGGYFQLIYSEELDTLISLEGSERLVFYKADFNWSQYKNNKGIGKGSKTWRGLDQPGKGKVVYTAAGLGARHIGPVSIMNKGLGMVTPVLPEEISSSDVELGDTTEFITDASDAKVSGDILETKNDKVTVTDEAAKGAAGSVDQNIGETHPIPVFKEVATVKLKPYMISYNILGEAFGVNLAKDAFILKVKSGTTGLRYFYLKDGEKPSDGKFIIQDKNGKRAEKIYPDREYVVSLFITDNGDYDMDKAVNSILDPAVIAKPLAPDTKPDTKPEEGGSGGGGCSAGFAGLALLALVPFVKRED